MVELRSNVVNMTCYARPIEDQAHQDFFALMHEIEQGRSIKLGGVGLCGLHGLHKLVQEVMNNLVLVLLVCEVHLRVEEREDSEFLLFVNEDSARVALENDAPLTSVSWWWTKEYAHARQ